MALTRCGISGPRNWLINSWVTSAIMLLKRILTTHAKEPLQVYLPERGKAVVHTRIKKAQLSNKFFRGNFESVKSTKQSSPSSGISAATMALKERKIQSFSAMSGRISSATCLSEGLNGAVPASSGPGTRHLVNLMWTDIMRLNACYWKT